MPSGGSDCGRSTKSGGGPQDRADIAGVLNTSENDDERSTRAGRSGKEFVKREFLGLDERGDALGMLGVGDAFEKAVGGPKHGEADIGAADEGGEALTVAFAGFAEENGFDAAGGPESFFNEARALDADGALFGGKAAAESDTELFEPAVFAAGKEVGCGGGFGRRGHWRKVNKFAGWKAIGVEVSSDAETCPPLCRTSK